MNRKIKIKFSATPLRTPDLHHCFLSLLRQEAGNQGINGYAINMKMKYPRISKYYGFVLSLLVAEKNACLIGTIFVNYRNGTFISSFKSGVLFPYRIFTEVNMRSVSFVLF